MKWSLAPAFAAFAACAVPPVNHLGPVVGPVTLAGRTFSSSQAGVLEHAGATLRRFVSPGCRVFGLAGRAAVADVPALLLLGGGEPASLGELVVYSLAGDELARTEVADDLVYDVALHPTAPIAVAACADGLLRRFTVPDLQRLPLVWRHAAAAVAAAFSPDGGLLASAGLDGKLLLGGFDANEPRPLLDHTAPVTCLAWSPDGQQLASGARDGKVRLHDRTGRLLRTWARLGGAVRAVGFTAHGWECVIDGPPDAAPTRRRL